MFLVSLGTGAVQPVAQEGSVAQERLLAGTGEARAEFGTRLLWGAGIEQDVDRARSVLETAAADGDLNAKETLGEALIAGVISPADAGEGVRLLQEAAVAGSTKAMVTHGRFLLYGRDLPRDLALAEQLFERAADAGNGEGLNELGSFLMWNRRDPGRAEALLTRAGQMGVSTAWVTLAEGAMYGFLGNRQRARFDEFAEKARAAGAERIDVLDAARRQWGITIRASGPEALALLELATETGNATALKALIALNRDGNQYNIRKSPMRAKGHLETHADLLTASEFGYYVFSLDAAAVRTTRDFRSLTERYIARDWSLTKALAEDLYAANPNFVIYLLQEDMKSRGVYTSLVNGLASQATIQALFEECRELPYRRDCRNDVLSPGVIADLLPR